MNEIVITLKKPVQLNGITVNQLRMREPTLGDQLDVNQLAKNNEEREIMMLSRLCDCAHTDLRALTLRDYAALQDAFFALPLTSLPQKTWWILARRLAAELGWGRAEIRACPVHEIPDWLGIRD